MGRTHEALRRAEARYESKYSDNLIDFDVLKKLKQMNLSEEELAKQNLSELMQSLKSKIPLSAKPESKQRSQFHQMAIGEPECNKELVSSSPFF